MNQLQFPVSVGTIVVAWNSDGLLSQVRWSSWFDTGFFHNEPLDTPAYVREVVAKLRAYFSEGAPIGELDWDRIEQTGMTAFQRQVYQAISRIPHGETRTYGWVASRVGKLNATRAVGQALRNNPLPIVIPCHRVVSSTSLGGFMGASDPNEPEMIFKRRLISLEEEYRNPVFSFLLGGGHAAAAGAF